MAETTGLNLVNDELEADCDASPQAAANIKIDRLKTVAILIDELLRTSSLRISGCRTKSEQDDQPD